MVVLLAIAGSVAAVLLNRAGQETANLEGGVSSTAYGITNEQGCNIGGFEWVENHPALTSGADFDGLAAAGRSDAHALNVPYCKP